MNELIALEGDLTAKKGEKTALQAQYRNGEIDEDTYLTRLSTVNQEIDEIS